MATEHKDSASEPSTGKKGSWLRTLRRWAVITASLAVVAVAEMKTSFVQSKVFRRVAEGKNFTETRTTDSLTAAPASGPYDERLGYTETLKFRQNLTRKGYVLENEVSWQEHSILGVRLFPIYNEKAQAGLQISDHTGMMLFDARFPRQVYTSFDSIPPLLVNSLLFVENRELMADHTQSWNPAIEWERLGKAMINYGLKHAGGSGDNAGGSTLATQTEKFRHSPDGLTSSASDKLRQMLTASVRAYQHGENTVKSRQDIVLNYLNAMPLAAARQYGEVEGFADGMAAWFGTSFADANRLLKTPEAQMNDTELKQAAKVYRQTLSLVMAVKKPSVYLVKDHDALEKRIDAYLPLLAEAGIITERMKNAVLAERVTYADNTATAAKAVSQTSKSTSSLQVDLLNMLGVNNIYALNRLDLTAKTTIDIKTDHAVAQKLHDLNKPEVAAAHGLTGYRLLNPETAGDIVYAFTLYERKDDGTNVLRVQTDNFKGALNLNEGSKLELGSTAKLRTMVSYLDAVRDLHDTYAAKPADALRTIKTSSNDRLTRWALDYLSPPGADKSLNTMLEASLDRTYSANPGETFFTGGGAHTFENFDKKDNGRVVTVKEAFHNSINLPFIRMMRDIVYYTESQKMHVDPAIFTDPDNLQRKEYLEEFAQTEGKTFLWKAWAEQKNKTPEEVAQLLAAKTRRTPVHLAIVYRTLYPKGSADSMQEFIQKEGRGANDKRIDKLYEDYAPGKFDLNDLGYITGIHPLALWLAGHKAQHPQTTWDQADSAARDTKVLIYKWLFKPNKFEAQNTRIRTMLEKDAFTHIQETWKSTGFPFEKMVASYASALGASGDTPAALSTLAGIVQNDGLYIPVSKFDEIDFAKNTPYAMDFHAGKPAAIRVLPIEVTDILRREMQKVVEEGTARRAYNSVTLSDGTVLPVGAKTGTGDNRMQTFNARGGVTSSNAKSRTATFVYTIDDRFFGCVTAYVDGPSAGSFKFTSALPAQVFKAVAPDLQPLLDKAYGITPEKIAQSKKNDTLANGIKAKNKSL